MLEIYEPFESLMAWKAWYARNEKYFSGWRDELLMSIRKHGIEEPVTGFRRSYDQLTIKNDNLRESISTHELNSRKRAALHCLSLEVEKNYGHQAKILGTEALTRVARILNSKFVYYKGTEYLPRQDEKDEHFPITHMDLSSIQFASNTFDIFHSGDVFEHVPNLPKCISEISRILKPNGVIISTFPFLPWQENSKIRAIEENGEIVHLETPEYHGNPARPGEGSLVFSVPAWDIIDLCHAAGLHDAQMLFIISTRFGVLSSGAPGVFVLRARKSHSTAKHGLRAVPKGILSEAGEGHHVSTVIGIAALPRSGTTLLTSIFAVHPSISSIYEPWNAHKAADTSIPTDFEEFAYLFRAEINDKMIVVIKETTTRLKFTENLSKLIASVKTPMNAKLVWLIRSPIHVFLSEVSARRDWWGESDIEITASVFEGWAQRSISGLRALARYSLTMDATIISYDWLVDAGPDGVRRVMSSLDIELDDKQLAYEKALDRSIVRGDVSLSNHPASINSESKIKRENEAYQSHGSISAAASYEIVDKVRVVFEDFAVVGLTHARSRSGQALIGDLLVALDSLKPH